MERRTDVAVHSRWRKSDQLNTCATKNCAECKQPKSRSEAMLLNVAAQQISATLISAAKADDDPTTLPSEIIGEFIEVPQ